jgi:hypothetical protein
MATTSGARDSVQSQHAHGARQFDAGNKGPIEAMGDERPFKRTYLASV